TVLSALLFSNGAEEDSEDTPESKVEVFDFCSPKVGHAVLCAPPPSKRTRSSAFSSFRRHAEDCAPYLFSPPPIFKRLSIAETTSSRNSSGSCANCQTR